LDILGVGRKTFGWSIFRNHLLFDANLLIYATLYKVLGHPVQGALRNLMEDLRVFPAFLKCSELRQSLINHPIRYSKDTALGSISGIV
jgi:hypothetical protein